MKKIPFALLFLCLFLLIVAAEKPTIFFKPSYDEVTTIEYVEVRADTTTKKEIGTKTIFVFPRPIILLATTSGWEAIQQQSK